jgi:hypothetical protein
VCVQIVLALELVPLVRRHGHRHVVALVHSSRARPRCPGRSIRA